MRRKELVMTPRYLAALACLALFLGTAIAQERPKLPNGPAPRFFSIAQIGKDDVELQEVGPTTGGFRTLCTYRPALKDIEVYDARGRRLTARDFHQRARVGAVVLVAADANRVDPAYFAVLKEDALVLVGVVVRVEAAPIKPMK
jgi:hypothetical protein